ncbi:MAG TPA: penicillin-binding transpeptidase domain-containing protein [Candidatus Paceibacterota bacterium]
MVFGDKHHYNIDIDEIFLDGHNTPGYHRESLEGVLERPMSRRVFFLLGTLFVMSGVVFLLRAGFLQIVNASVFRERSLNNYLRLVEQPAERGLIYDRDGVVLATNEFRGFFTSASSTYYVMRRYPEQGFLHALGFLRKDNNRTQGASGIEKQYNTLLRGIAGERIEEVNVTGSVISFGIRVASQSGAGIVTSLSRNLQQQLARSIERVAYTNGFSGGAGVVLDVSNGAVLALVSVPEFDPNIFTEGLTQEKLDDLLYDPGKPFFNRAVSGLYPPGSIVKPALAAGALAENIIDPEETILTNGRLVLENPYFPDKPSVFLDWKNHGLVDMRRALAVSSDVYFYTIGGGYESQRGLGISKINQYLALFGFGEMTGIDLPVEKQGLLPDQESPSRSRAWTVGDTYNVSIGQGDILVTPIQMAVYAAALATGGTVLQPSVAQRVVDDRKNTIQTLLKPPRKNNILPKDFFRVIQEGMRDAVMYGTAQGLSGIPIPIAAKTGTAEIGKTGRVHSWSIGFAPFDQPKIAFVVLMESGSSQNLIGATAVASEVLQWMHETRFLDSL